MAQTVLTPLPVRVRGIRVLVFHYQCSTNTYNIIEESIALNVAFVFKTRTKRTKQRLSNLNLQIRLLHRKARNQNNDHWNHYHPWSPA
ncbi:hypothetical protein GDO86_018269 [Hymenochirus boettgeri]|uniref:Uncharacterized protein n=1 Tax=Hymenochirus boettgeri TaxID=247094 RepID=A0A8T2IEA5_9PIPI|nr:hypothetical protein GDO86_018269 [Hymenochirus boettgeri]